MLTFERPVEVKRPHGSYRFDVFSLKAGRRMTLYGKAAVCQFIRLESDSKISNFCERPLAIADSRPRRVVDFWALRDGKATLYLLVREGEPRLSERRKQAFGSFVEWAASQGAQLLEVSVEDFAEQRVALDNWASILQHVISHRDLVGASFCDRLLPQLPDEFTLDRVENSIGEADAMLVRAGVFSLLLAGRLKCSTIDSAHLHALTGFARI